MGVMARHTTNTAPETPAGRRTVLLLLQYGKDEIKSGVYDQESGSRPQWPLTPTAGKVFHAGRQGSPDSSLPGTVAPPSKAATDATD